MLTPWDEFLCHQLPTTMDHVYTSDPSWTERVYISLYDVTNKDMIVGCGIGQYPNRNVQDGFATVWHQGKQHNFRASRTLRPNPYDIKIGPLSIEILEGLRRFRMRLDENPSGISFDIEWTATMNPHEEEHDFRRSNGRVVQDISRFDQVGRARGQLRIPGKQVAMTESNWWSHRDRSWGTRRPLRTDSAASNQTKFAPFLFSWSVAQFADYALHWRFVERKAGRYSYFTGEIARPLGTKIEPGWILERTEQEFRWETSGVVQTLKSGDIDLFFENGESRHVSFVSHPPRWHLKGGGYGGYRGWQQGDSRGEYYCEHEVWDLNDPAILREASTLSDHLIEWRCGNDTGFGIMEYGVGPGYYKYKDIQHLPTF
ncbi:MAG: hypothetical protein Q7S58_02045 [Candidatus Binatus sp.]|uniref:hypothetical protein n=1 Tax=Candidatus Binatus sp. TaxID=2811406 RepID=UPI002720583C|nr:hypothetical protein [Candidatus Binatus sp.]MDO8431171.1 hypothetical protein [Candidatus Binatus sp.]